MSPVTLRIRELREALQLSQAELARRAGIQRATVNIIERGKSKGIDFDTLARLAEALGVNAAALIAHEPSRKARRVQG